MAKKPILHFTSEPHHITIDAHGKALVNRLFVFMLALIAFFNIVDLTFNYEQPYPNAFKDICNLAREDSIAAWYSSFSLLLAAGMLWLIVVIQKAQKATRFKFFGWLLIALFFTYLGIDDATEFHERIGTSFAEYARAHPQVQTGTLNSAMETYSSYNWHVLFMPAFSAMGLFILFFLWKELRSADLRFFLVFSLGCLAVAVGLDYFEGRESWHPGVANTLGLTVKALNHYQRMLEESLELLGAASFVRTFFSHFVRISKNISLKFL